MMFLYNSSTDNGFYLALSLILGILKSNLVSYLERISFLDNGSM